MPSSVKDKDGKPIEQGDSVWTRIRGGRHEGEVEQVATTGQEAKDANVKNPPKVSLSYVYFRIGVRTYSMLTVKGAL